MFKRKNVYASVATAIMMIAAVVLKEREIIFPEIAAIAIGWLAAPKKSWKVKEYQMILMITICAFAGIGIVKYLEVSAELQMIIAFAFAQTIYLISGTTFMPAISAAVLPVLLQTETLIYPISAIVFTVIVCALGSLDKRIEKLESDSIDENEESGALEEIGKVGKIKEIKISVYGEANKENVRANKIIIWLKGAIRIFIVAILVFIFLPADMRFCVAPPLFVAFTELTSGSSKAVEKPIKVVGLVTICAILGMAIKTICILIPDVSGDAGMGMNIIIGSIFVCFATQYIMEKFKMWMPPAGALAILPFLIGDGLIKSKGILIAAVIYPAQIFLGISIITIIAYIAKKLDVHRL